MKPKAPHFFHIVLVEPEIPQNTGTIGRSCVGGHAQLHLVGKLGFKITDSNLKRAGLDYWQHLTWTHHPTWEDWWSIIPDTSRVFFFEKEGKQSLYRTELKMGDWLVFGKETKGLDDAILEKYDSQVLSLPMFGPIRSLNLSNAVSVALYEGLRQVADLDTPTLATSSSSPADNF